MTEISNIVDKLIPQYLDRYHLYNNIDKTVVRKILLRFKRGREIRWQDLRNYSAKLSDDQQKGEVADSQESLLNKILVDIPQIDLAKETIKKKIVDIFLDNEPEIHVIYGKYGEGKSQITQVFEEWFEDAQFANIVYTNHSVTTLGNVLTKLSGDLKNRFQKTSFLPKITPLLDKLDIILQKPDFHQNAAMDIVIKITQLLTEYKYLLVLSFDELDKILTSTTDFKPFADFFVTLNDQSNLRLLILMFIPEISIYRMKQIDSRMTRWDSYFGLDATRLRGKYGEHITEAIANILAIKSVLDGRIYTEYLPFIASIINSRYDIIHEMNIREVNIWAVQFGEMLYNLDNNQCLQKLNFHSDKGTLEKLLTDNLEIFLQSVSYASFIEKSQIKGINYKYNYNYVPDGIGTENYVSNGYFKLQRVLETNLETITDIAVQIKILTGDKKDIGYLKPLKELLENYPTILFLIGASKDYVNEIYEVIDKWKEKNPLLFDIDILQLDQQLSLPLVTIGDATSNKIISSEDMAMLLLWSKQFVPILPQLEAYFRSLTEKLHDRKIAIRTKQLEKLSTKKLSVKQDSKELTKKSIDKSVETAKTGDFTASDVTDSSFVNVKGLLISRTLFDEGLKYFCRYIDTIKSYKTIDILLRETKQLMNSLYPDTVVQFEELQPLLLNELLDKSLIIKDRRGKKDIIRKGDNWNSEEALTILKNRCLQLSKK
jgi:DNA-directed RNA polymerase subunit F